MIRMLFTGLALSIFIAPLAAEATIPLCPNGVPPETEKEDFVKAKNKAASDNPGSVYSNRTSPGLPRVAGVKKNYYEYDLGSNATGGAGQHRAVLLVEAGSVLVAYYTADHYKSWCKIDIDKYK